jgi:arabinogalactan endo-1,4-beta-galactosidase
MKRFPITILASLLLIVLSGYCATNASANPLGKYVTIRANTLSEVVEVDGSGDLIANQLSWDGSKDEQFIEVSNSDGTVSFYSVSAGLYVSAHSTSTQLVADSTTIGAQQEFEIQPSLYTGWAPAGDDEAIYSVGIGTYWSINSATDGSIYSPTADAAGEWQNMSVMPAPILPGGFNTNHPHPGADVSEGLGAQNAGVVFKDINGVSGDYLKILKKHGVRWVRCRINVNPTLTPDNYGLLQTTEYVTEVLTAAKADGFKVLLDFQLSDTWASPSAQTTPAAWSTTDITTLESQLQTYLTSVMGTLASNHAWPDMIQIGNEVDGGMLWPLGNAWVNGDWNSNYPLLYNTAYTAISNAAAQLDKPMPKIMLHLSSSGNLGSTRFFLDDAIAAGMQFDVIGLSYYEMWDGVVANMKATIDELSYRYPTKEIAIAETAYYYTPYLIAPTDPLTYPTTEAGQEQFLRDVGTQVGLNPNLRYVFYWGTNWSEPQLWYTPWPDSSNTGQDTANRALFNGSGRLLPAINVLTSY